MRRVCFLATGILFALLFMMICSSHCFAARRAVLVGVANYRHLPATTEKGRILNNLKGPVNDVELMKDTLISVFGFKKEEIKTLINEQATRQNIENTFNQWLVKGTKKGDMAVFFFSGHGSRVPDQNGDEEDGLDEVILPYDMVPKGGYNMIIDDEFGEWLRKLSGRNVVVMLDSCYSGGMTRSIEKTDWNEKYITITDYVPSRAAMAIPKGPDVPDGVIFMAASQKNQPALESGGIMGIYGGFTRGLHQAMKSVKNPTYRTLFDYAKGVVVDNLKLPQMPAIEGKETLLRQYAFKDVPLPSSPSPLPQRVERPVPQSSPPQRADCPTTPPPPPQKTDNRPAPPPEIVGNTIRLAIGELKGATQSDIDSLKQGFSRLSFVTIVSQDGFFDRLIRGEKMNGTYSVRLLNKVGDAEPIPPVRSIGELTAGLSGRLNSAYMVKRLLAIHNPSPSLKVKLTVADENRRDFTLGEEVFFKFSADKDCYIYLISADQEGSFNIIFPNVFHKNNFVKANTEVTIPDEGMRKERFLFRFRPPAGEETVKLIATTRPITLESVDLSSFKGPMVTVRGATRRIVAEGIETQINAQISTDETGVPPAAVHTSLPQQKFEWATDIVVVRSHKAE